MADLKNRILADAGLGDISATVSSLTSAPGYTLGEARTYNNVDYVLVFNAGNSAIPTGFHAVANAGGGGYSVTISSVGPPGILNERIGGVVSNHVSVPTGHYFWGAKRGVLASGLVASTVSIASGAAYCIGANGVVQGMPQSVVTGLHPIGVALTTIVSLTSGGGARSGSAYIDLV